MRRPERGFGLALALLVSSSAVAQPPARPILPERLVGRWSDSGDCAKYVVFRSDGTFRAHTGGEGSWRLVRGRLTMTGGGAARELTVRRLDLTTLEVVHPDGSIGRSRRC